MTRHLPPLAAIRAFEAFSRVGTVRGAADELAVSHTVISRHIKNLEASLHADLVEKSGRILRLTSEGRRFSEHLRRAFDTIADAASEVRNGAAATLHICCMAGLASRRLLGRLPALQASLPGCEVILEPTTARPDFDRGEADIEIVYLENAVVAEGLRAELFARPRILAIASPAFKARHPEARTPADLVHLTLIHERSTRQWEAWLERAGVTTIPSLRGPRLWHGHLTIEAARLGQGVALVSDLIAADGIAAGELVEMVPTAVRYGGYYVIAPVRRWRDPAIAGVRTWLAETFPDSAPGERS